MEADERELVRRWVEQWQETGAFLESVRRGELRKMTDEAALSAITRIFAVRSPVPLSAERQHTSGLIEQQRLFHLRPGR